MPWVLGEYLDIGTTPHDHEFTVRQFDNEEAARDWGQQFAGQPNIMFRVLRLGTANLPNAGWLMSNTRNTLYHYDAISAAVSPPGFAFVGEGFAHNNREAIHVNRWEIRPVGEVFHNCNRERTWRHQGRAMRDPRTRSLWCGSCGQHVTYDWLRRRATSIATASRGGE